MKRRDVYLKLTRHNGRAGTHGTYNPKHNDRSFNLANSEHIDPERVKGNIYWDCFHGFRSALDPQDPDNLAATFSDVERQFYESRYSNFVESQNERNAKIRHTERNRSIPDLLSSRKTCPEETIYQLGTLDEHASAEDLLNLVTEFIEAFKAKYGDHVHVLDWALHLDESTPHIHERHVFDCENKYGEIAPQQEKALEALGFDLPDPGKPLSRRNNRKITFDAACRKMLFEIAKRHGLELEEEAEYGNRKYLEKQDFILAKQKKQLAAQQNKLDKLTLKVNDMEALIDEVSAAAYDKAVEVVTDVVRTETRKEDMRMIEDTKKWVLSPERKAPKATREYAAHRLDTVLDKFLKTMQQKWNQNFDDEPMTDIPQKFLNAGCDVYMVMQLRHDEKILDERFASMRELHRRGKTPDPEHYEVTYYADLPAMWQDVPNNEVLEELFQMFNLSRPQDFEGHSLSVSDVIALKRNGEVSVHYVDSIGFKDLQGFLDKQPERPSVLMNLKEKCDAPECNPTGSRKARTEHEL